MTVPAVIAFGVSALLSAATIGGPATGRSERISRAVGSVVWISAGDFTMGSDDAGLVSAVDLCESDPFARNAGAVEACFGRSNGVDVSLCQSSVDPQRCGPYDARGHAVRCPSALIAREAGEHTVWLDAYGIDRTEVSVAQYDRCVRAGACSAGPVLLGSPQFGAGDQPMVGVTWTDAVAFCASARGRLPTEAEWERAARGRDGRRFPWGNLWNPRYANHGSLDPTHAQLGIQGCYDDNDGYALTAPVGSFPAGASPEGALDMAGNAWEWTQDLWQDLENVAWSRSESRYPTARDPADRVRVVAPTGASHGSAHVIRGGGYDVPAFALRATFRLAAGALTRSLSIGFRCAYDVR